MQGLGAFVEVVTVAVVVVLTKVWMLSATSTVVPQVSPGQTSVPGVPVIVMTVLVDGALLETVRESTELAVPPGSGVTGLTLKPPLTPSGKADAVRVTGELKPPTECTLTVICADPPGLKVRLLGSAERLNRAWAVTVNVPVAALPMLPSAITM